MSIKVTTAQIKTLIKNVRCSFSEGNAPKLGANLEQAAHAFGFATWDALSGVAADGQRENQNATFPAGKEPFTLMEMYALGEDGEENDEDPNTSAPRSLKLQLTGELVARIMKLQALVKKEGLMYTKVKVSNLRYEARADVDCSYLVVGDTYFWVEGAYGSCAEFEYETQPAQIHDMVRRLDIWKQRDVHYPMVISTLPESKDEFSCREPILRYMVEQGILPVDALVTLAL